MSSQIEEFDRERPRLHAIAVRMLGSSTSADDVVQDAWLRLHAADGAAIENLPAWLTTVVSRLCLDRLRASSARTLPLDESPELQHPSPAHEAELADDVGEALLVVLQLLSPAERLAFVLHDVFALPFTEISEITGRTPAAVRQLASRGRRRVHGASTESADRGRQHTVVKAFLTASRTGDFAALFDLLDPSAAVRSDAAAAAMGSPEAVLGRSEVAEFFNGRAKAARFVTIDGYAGAAWTLRGDLKVAFGFTVIDDLVVEIELIADPEVLRTLDIAFRVAQ